MNYFTSDIHFSDPETMQHDRRPFKNIKEYDKKTIKTWNKIMNKNDTLYVVGDLFDCIGPESEVWKQSAGYFKKIKANIILVMGNNEDRIVKYFFNNNFKKFKEYCLSLGIKDVVKNTKISFGGYKFYLVHKPINYKEGYVNLVGHLHRSRGQWFSFGLNVSCDLNHYRPYSEDEILFQLKEKKSFYDSDENFSVI